jgi:hypothetical protein
MDAFLVVHLGAECRLHGTATVTGKRCATGGTVRSNGSSPGSGHDNKERLLPTKNDWKP